MVGLERHIEMAEYLRANKPLVIEATKEMFKVAGPRKFTGAANTKADVEGRIDAFSEMIASVLGK
jgi:hypothetical protein